VLPAGLTYDAGTRRISGTPTTGNQENGWLFVRITDADGDPAWRLFTINAVSPTAGIAIEPVADSSLQLWNANNNQGASTQLWSSGHSSFGWGAYSYLRFDLQDFACLSITNARVRLTVEFVEPASANVPARLILHNTSEAWQEATLVGTNAPAIGSMASAPVAIPARGEYEFDVTEAVGQAMASGDSLVSFVIQPDVNAYGTLILRSREHGTPAERPRLSVQFTSSNASVPAIAMQPSDRTTCVGGAVTFAATSAPTAGGLVRYQWQISDSSAPGGWRELLDGVDPALGTISGAAGSTLALSGVRAGASRAVRCTISNACAPLGVTTRAAALRICIADVDDGTASGRCDGGVGIEDLLYYLELYSAGVIAADVDDGSGLTRPDGGVGVEDLLHYLARFEDGC
jgi:hypothetical protein